MTRTAVLADGVPGALVPSLLLLELTEGPAHGYDLIERLRLAGSRSGTVYRSLRALEDDGLVASGWETTQKRGPARRVYRLTPAGRKALRDSVPIVERIVVDLTAFVARAKPTPRR